MDRRNAVVVLVIVLLAGLIGATCVVDGFAEECVALEVGIRTVDSCGATLVCVPDYHVWRDCPGGNCRRAPLGGAPLVWESGLCYHSCGPHECPNVDMISMCADYRGSGFCGYSRAWPDPKNPRLPRYLNEWQSAD